MTQLTKLHGRMRTYLNQLDRNDWAKSRRKHWRTRSHYYIHRIEYKKKYILLFQNLNLHAGVYSCWLTDADGKVLTYVPVGKTPNKTWDDLTEHQVTTINKILTSVQ